MPQAVHSDLVLYEDDLDLTFQHKDIHINEHKINRDFANLCQWFIDKKLISILVKTKQNVYFSVLIKSYERQESLI